MKIKNDVKYIIELVALHKVLIYFSFITFFLLINQLLLYLNIKVCSHLTIFFNKIILYCKVFVTCLKCVRVN